MNSIHIAGRSFILFIYWEDMTDELILKLLNFFGSAMCG